MVESKDTIIGSKILVDFLRDFTQLMEAQLLTIRAMMGNSVADVMESVMAMSNIASEKKVKANEILVMDEKTQEFVASSREVLEQNEKHLFSNQGDGHQRKDKLENKLMRTGGIFSKHMEAISGLDKDLQNLIAKVIGAVSVDDVIAQRLSHIISSLRELQSELSKLLASYKQQGRVDNIKQFRNRVLTQVYLSYTSEEEKEIFHKVFGHPKVIKRVV